MLNYEFDEDINKSTQITLLDESILWKIQKDIYTKKGKRIWTDGLIQNEISDNCFTAKVNT